MAIYRETRVRWRTHRPGKMPTCDRQTTASEFADCPIEEVQSNDGHSLRRLGSRVPAEGSSFAGQFAIQRNFFAEAEHGVGVRCRRALGMATVLVLAIREAYERFAGENQTGDEVEIENLFPAFVEAQSVKARFSVTERRAHDEVTAEHGGESSFAGEMNSTPARAIQFLEGIGERKSRSTDWPNNGGIAEESGRGRVGRRRGEHGANVPWAEAIIVVEERDEVVVYRIDAEVPMLLD